MDTYSRTKLIEICKERKLKGYSGLNKEKLIQLLSVKPQVESQDKPLEANVEPQVKTNVLSLFSGMGGMDVGFAEQVIVHSESILSSDYIDSSNSTNVNIDGFVNLKRLPFNIVFQNDILPAAKKVAELNQWNHNYVLKDIQDILKDDTYEFPAADVITGGFPCQDFSHAGKRQGFDSNRGTLYQSYVEVVKRVKPILFIAENVNGLLTMAGNPIQKIMSDFAAVGSKLAPKIKFS